MRPSAAATAPGVESRRAASDFVSCPLTSCAISMSRSLAGNRSNAAAISPCSSWSIKSSTGAGRDVLVCQQVGLPTGEILALEMRGDQVARGGRGVRGQRVALDPGSGSHHPRQCLLDEIINHVGVLNPGADDPANHRNELHQTLTVRHRLTWPTSHTL